MRDISPSPSADVQVTMVSTGRQHTDPATREPRGGARSGVVANTGDAVDCRASTRPRTHPQGGRAMNRMRLGITLLLVAAVAASLSTQSCTSGKVEATPAAAVDPVV